MKKLLSLMMVTLLLAVFGVASAEAAPSDTISVTVTITADAVDVSVSPSSWAIGNITASSTPDTVGSGPDYFTATNDRNADEDLTLTIASSADWTAANSAGADQFGMNYSTAGGTPSWSPIDSSTGALLADDLGAGASETFDLQLEAPTSTTVGGTQQSIVVTVTAS